MKKYILTFESRKLKHVIIFESEASKHQVKKAMEFGNYLAAEVLFKRMTYKNNNVVKYLEYRITKKSGKLDGFFVEKTTTGFTINSGRLSSYPSKKFKLPKIEKYCLKEFKDSAFLLLMECGDADKLDDMLFDYNFEEESL